MNKITQSLFLTLCITLSGLIHAGNDTVYKNSIVDNEETNSDCNDNSLDSYAIADCNINNLFDDSADERTNSHLGQSFIA